MIDRFYKLIILLLVFTTFQSCYKDSITQTVTEDSFTPFTVYESEISGLVSDINGDPIASALLSFGSQSTMTNQDGYFKLENIRTQATGTLLVIESEGFLTSYRNVALSKSIAVSLLIKLNRKPDIQSFESSQGGILDISENATIQFDANTVQKEGSPYDGNVLISMLHVSKDDPQLYQRTPAELIGINQDEETQFLETYGMVYITITDDAGNELQPASDSPAKLTVNIPSEFSTQAPQDMPIWSLDDMDGFWKEEGIATKVGNTYEADLPHFSWWNVDVPIGRLINVCMTIEEEASGELIKNQNVIISADRVPFGVQRTNNNGELCVLLPAGISMSVQFEDDCLSSSIADIGPFTEKENVIDIELSINENTEEVNFSGIVTDCQDEILVLDYIIIKSKNTRFNIPIAEDGSYSFKTLCPKPNDLTEVFAYDPSTQKSYSRVTDFAAEADGTIPDFTWDIKVCEDPVSIVIANFFGEDIIDEIDSIVTNPNETILVLSDN